MIIDPQKLKYAAAFYRCKKLEMRTINLLLKPLVAFTQGYNRAVYNQMQEPTVKIIIDNICKINSNTRLTRSDFDTIHAGFKLALQHYGFGGWINSQLQIFSNDYLLCQSPPTNTLRLQNNQAKQLVKPASSSMARLAGNPANSLTCPPKTPVKPVKPVTSLASEIRKITDHENRMINLCTSGVSLKLHIKELLLQSTDILSTPNLKHALKLNNSAALVTINKIKALLPVKKIKNSEITFKFEKNGSSIKISQNASHEVVASAIQTYVNTYNIENCFKEIATNTNEFTLIFFKNTLKKLLTAIKISEKITIEGPTYGSCDVTIKQPNYSAKVFQAIEQMHTFIEALINIDSDKNAISVIQNFCKKSAESVSDELISQELKAQKTASNLSTIQNKVEGIYEETQTRLRNSDATAELWSICNKNTLPSDALLAFLQSIHIFLIDKHVFIEDETAHIMCNSVKSLAGYIDQNNSKEAKKMIRLALENYAILQKITADIKSTH